MGPREPFTILCHEAPDLFREAVRFTAAQTGFSPRLIEKDYFCSVLLERLAAADAPLVFRGGTCLAKVHAGFYRLSEDLDFVIPMPVDAPRRRRSEHGRRVMDAVAALPAAASCFRITEPVKGANLSTHYSAVLSFESLLSRHQEPIRIEIGLREPLLMPPTEQPAKSILMDPVSGATMVAPVTVRCMSRTEAFAEKLRAALTRREPAIRDFFDVDFAVRNLGIRPQDTELVELLKCKLVVPGNDPVNVGPDRLAQLRGQIDARLKPVLREPDFRTFDLDRAFEVVSEMAAQLS